MTIYQVRELMCSEGWTDSWWLLLDDTTEPKPMSMDEIEARIAANPHTKASIRQDGSRTWIWIIPPIMEHAPETWKSRLVLNWRLNWRRVLLAWLVGIWGVIVVAIIVLNVLNVLNLPDKPETLPKLSKHELRQLEDEWREGREANRRPDPEIILRSKREIRKSMGFLRTPYFLGTKYEDMDETERGAFRVLLNTHGSPGMRDEFWDWYRNQ